MTADSKFLVWGEGQGFANGEKLPEIQEIGLNFGIENITQRKGDGGGNIVVATGAPLSGRVNFAAMSPQLLALLIGGSNAVGTVLRKRPVTLTKSTDTVTLADATRIENTLEIIPVGANKAPLKKVASSPAIGEYSISGTAVTLNASQTEDDFYVDYLYSDASNGLTTSVGPSDLPSSFELYATMRAKDLFSDAKGDVVYYMAKAERTSELSLIGTNGEAANPGFDFNVRIDVEADFATYWP